jgi:hypothetical protein
MLHIKNSGYINPTEVSQLVKGRYLMLWSANTLLEKQPCSVYVVFIAYRQEYGAALLLV